MKIVLPGFGIACGVIDSHDIYVGVLIVIVVNADCFREKIFNLSSRVMLDIFSGESW